MSIRRSLGIVSVTRLVVFLISFASVIVVSRLLTPAEIGVFSVSVALVGIAHVFRDFGVGQYLIQLREVTEDKKRAAFTVTLAISWMIAIAIFSVRGLAADFYGHSGVSEILAFTAINFLMLPIGAPLKTLLQRDMQFGKLAVVSISHHIVQAGVTIGAAMTGSSYMSLAWGSIAGTMTNVLLMVAISPSGALQRPTFRGWGEVFRFGSQASGAMLASALGRGAPDMILGRTLGFESVGYFSRATGLISALLDQLLYVVQSVYVPAFAKGIREGRNPAPYYADATALLTGATVPAIGLLALLSPLLIQLMFGAQWDRAAPLAQALCAYALITAPFAIGASSLSASGHVGTLFRCTVLIEVSRVLVLLTSVWLTLEWVVVALGASYLLQAVLYMSALRQTIGLGVGQLWASVLKSYVLLPFAVVPAGLFVLLEKHTQWGGPFWALLVSGLMGVGGWVVGIMLLNHPLKADMVRAASLAWHKIVRRS